MESVYSFGHTDIVETLYVYAEAVKQPIIWAKHGKLFGNLRPLSWFSGNIQQTLVQWLPHLPDLFHHPCHIACNTKGTVCPRVLCALQHWLVYHKLFEGWESWTNNLVGPGGHLVWYCGYHNRRTFLGTWELCENTFTFPINAHALTLTLHLYHSLVIHWIPRLQRSFSFL